MNWLLQNWQTIAALAVVGITAVLFVRHLLRREKSSCGGNCECPTKKMAQGAETKRP